MVRLMELVIRTGADTEYINITERVERCVREAGVPDGAAFIITAHTTTRITLNESLECLQSDMKALLAALVPEERGYSHARMLHSYGQSADNAPSHIRAMLTNNHAVLPIRGGGLCRGEAQEIFLAEYDGPQDRTVFVVVIGTDVC